MPEEWLVPAVIKYRDYGKWQSIVVPAANSAIQHTCSDYEIANFQNSRGVIQAKMEEKVRQKLEGSGLPGDNGVYARTISLQLRDVTIPDTYTNAVIEKQEAQEDIALAVNERIREITKANTEKLTAEKEAERIIATAENEAALIITEATLRAEETLYAFQQETNVLLSVKNDLNYTTDGILTFIANKMVEKAPSLKVSMGEPAKSSRKNDLIIDSNTS